MSMNFHISAKREIFVPATNEYDYQYETLWVYQTPTKVTEQLIESENPLGSYIEWVRKNFSMNEEISIYSEDDIFGEYEPVKTVTVNEAEEHITELLEKISTLKEKGYELEFSVC